MWLSLDSVQRCGRPQKRAGRRGCLGPDWGPKAEGAWYGCGWPSPWLRGLGLLRTAPPTKFRASRAQEGGVEHPEVACPELSTSSKGSTADGDGKPGLSSLCHLLGVQLCTSDQSIWACFLICKVGLAQAREVMCISTPCHLLSCLPFD